MESGDPVSGKVRRSKRRSRRAGPERSPGLAEVERELADLVPFVRFRVAAERDGVMVRILDPTTDSVVRRIPAGALLELRRRMHRSLGLLANDAR